MRFRAFTMRSAAVVAIMVSGLVVGACDSQDDSSDLPMIAGEWESDTFTHTDRSGTVVGEAHLTVHFEQTGSRVEGQGTLHLTQARVELPFEVDGSVTDASVQFNLLYDTAPPETITCSIDGDALLKCFKGSSRFNLTRPTS